MNISWTFHCNFIDMIFHGHLVDISWTFSGYIMENQWIYIMDIQWIYHGHSVDIAWTISGYNMDIQWTFDGHLMDIS